MSCAPYMGDEEIMCQLVKARECIMQIAGHTDIAISRKKGQLSIIHQAARTSITNTQKAKKNEC